MFGIFDGLKVHLLDAHQSFSSDNQKDRLVVAFEGEIYNSEELSSTLEGLGYKFRGKTDSELVANSYTAWGEDCVEKFNGAFSFCLYDRERGILFLARDQAGRRQLYYSDYNGEFIFSSHVKPIIETHSFPREIDLRALNYFLTFRYVPEGLCIFKHIKKLPSGCSILFNLRSREVELSRYWEISVTEPEAENENELLEELERILLNAVKIRMRGDLSLGAFLSGGLDSSLVVALISRFSPERIKTFGVGFYEGKYNELPYSRLVSNAFDTDHQEVIVGPNFDLFLESASIFDEPLGDPSIFPTYYGGKLAGENVQAIMSGDGADSLFLGMRSHYLSKRYGEIKRFFVPPLNWVSGKAAGLVPEEAKWRIFLEDITPVEFFSKRGVVFNESLRKQLLQGWVLDQLKESFYEPEKKETYGIDSLTGIMTILACKSLRNNTLFKVERVSSHFSFHVRTPFLDNELIEFAFTKVPGDMKIKGDVTKYLLKQLARKFLPPEFPFNRKQGLNPPFSEWLRNEWRDYLWDILMSGEERYLDRKFIRKLIERHKDPLFDQGRKLFALLVFKIWERKYLSGNGF
ncbi:MAG TPA: asparagine synthase (glutamine-hydrolyzing) [Thermodesulfobacteriota bacterium]|nr:asparagine synthase (glutamine-hydrolyzing) [Thermodesulfobacteriota bacterium]